MNLEGAKFEDVELEFFRDRFIPFPIRRTIPVVFRSGGR
jgi:hypothetical protein